MSLKVIDAFLSVLTVSHWQLQKCHLEHTELLDLAGQTIDQTVTSIFSPSGTCAPTALELHRRRQHTRPYNSYGDLMTVAWGDGALSAIISFGECTERWATAHSLLSFLC